MMKRLHPSLFPIACLATAVPLASMAAETSGFSYSPSLTVSAAHVRVANANFGAGRFDIQESQLEGNDSNWSEVYLKPGIDLAYQASDSLQWLAGANLVASDTLGDGDAGGFTNSKDGDVDIDLAWAGVQYQQWKFTAGRQNYMIGSGFIVMDGNLDMYDDGAYWLAPRTAFKASAVLAYESEQGSAQAFSLGVDRDLGAYRMTGLNADINVGSGSFGAAAFKVKSGGIDGMKVYNLRASQQSVPGVDGLLISAEYAKQSGSNGDIRYDANAWYINTDYHFGEPGSSPMISYRYATFSGDDDPNDNTVKSWNLLAKGYVDWGTWLIGDIAGNYLIYNSNEQVHSIRASYDLQPNLILGMLNHRIYLNEKNYSNGGPNVTAVSSTAFANESAVYLDWFPNEQTYVSLAYSLAKPLQAAKQALGDDTMSALELYLVWNY